MKIFTRVEWEWDGKLYRPVESESFDYHGPVALLKSDPLGLQDIVQVAQNHVENVAKGYQQDPERAALGINTKYEDAIWSKILGKDYQPLVGDLATEGSPHTANDRKTAQAKGIDTGSSEFVDGVAQAVAIYYGGEAIGGALGGAGQGTTLSGTSGTETLGGAGGNGYVGDLPLATDAPASTSLAESTGGVQTSGQGYLNAESTPPASTDATSVSSNAPTPADTVNGVPDTGSGASTSQTAQAEQNFVNGSQQAPANNGGIIQNMMQWAKENPYLAVGGASMGASAVKGVGDYYGNKEALKNKTASEKELLDKKAEEEMRLAEWRRQFIQGGSYYSGKLPFASGAQKPLLRPDATPVYNQNGGLIASAMNR